MTVTTLTPSHSNHDGAEIKDTGDQTENTDAILRFGDHTVKRHVAVIFPLPETGWLEGKNIVSAELSLRSAADDTGSFLQRVYLQDAESPANLSSGSAAFDISTRTHGSLFVEFGSAIVGEWMDGSLHSYTGDGGTTFANLITELMDSQDPANITGLCFLFINESGSGERLARSFDNGSNAPELHVTWVSASQDIPTRIITETVYSVTVLERTVVEAAP
jgi:hypothetical protein